MFENENKVLKQIIGPNPTMDDFTVATLVIEDVKKLNNKVHKLYPTRSNPTREAGFPNIDGCVKDVRVVIRKFLDVKPGEFKNLDDIELNKDLLMYQEEAKNRRRIFFEEIIAEKKFIRTKHASKKLPVFEGSNTFENMMKSINSLLQGEEDLELKCDILARINKVNGIKSEKKRFEALVEIHNDYLSSD